MYMGSNIIVHQIQNFPYLLYIILHQKMPGNEQLQISSPPTLRQLDIIRLAPLKLLASPFKTPLSGTSPHTGAHPDGLKKCTISDNILRCKIVTNEG